MAKGSKGASSYDPLAWLKDDDAAEPVAEASEEVLAVESETVAEAEPSAEVEELPVVPQRGEVALPEELTIAQVAELHSRWLLLLDGEGEVAMEAGAVAQVDAAGMQLLLGLARTLVAKGRCLSLRNPAPALVRGATLLGVAGDLGLANVGGA